MSCEDVSDLEGWLAHEELPGVAEAIQQVERRRGRENRRGDG